MTTRAGKPDTPADIELRKCLLDNPPTSFVMIAGAGSGKTTSVVKALTTIVHERGPSFKRHGQRVACITYTENAVNEIWKDVGENSLIHVSTIHSFLWNLIRPFQNDICEWVGRRIDAKLQELREEGANFGPRVRQTTRDANQRDIIRYEEQKQLFRRNQTFKYGKGSDYKEGILGHNDIISMVPELICGSALLRTIVAQKYPFVFVDESQDTTVEVVRALTAIDKQMGQSFCLGFFGDPMQKIYLTGIGHIHPEPDWKKITKPENFRCPTKVLDVANAIRMAGDGLVQTRGRMVDSGGTLQPVHGTARIFVLPADEHRSVRLTEVRAWVAARNSDPKWQADTVDSNVKVLVIVHRMAATRLGFADLYACFNDKAPSNFSDNFLDASLWPVKPFFSFILPVVVAMRHGREFEVMHLLRQHCPALAKEALTGADVAALLIRISNDMERLKVAMADDSRATVLEVLSLVRTTGLAKLDDRLSGYVDASISGTEPMPTQNEDPDDGEEKRFREVAAMAAYLACPAKQFWGYRTYINDESPFSTQQGIKGAEFDRVLTVLDDDEGTHVQFSYNKYFGIVPLSDRDLDRENRGEETTIDRTRRLFYVSCTRAVQDLVVIFFTEDIASALHHVTASAFFPPDNIHSIEDL